MVVILKEPFMYLCGLKEQHSYIGVVSYSYDICRKYFNKWGNLNLHVHTHTGDCPFRCDMCKKSLRWQCHLELQLRNHTGEHLFTCDVCEKSFILES